MSIKRKLIPAIVLYAAAGGAAAEPTQTFAERLGWGPEDRLAIYHVDDVGMSHASNLGAIEALENGLANSISIMMPCPWVPEIAAYLKEHPEVDAGLHLTMNAEWDFYRWGPVAGKHAVPGLVDPMGALWDNVGQVAEHANADEVETEIRAQIDRAHTLGIQPTHMDSHMGALFDGSEFFARYVKVGMEKQIPVLMTGSRAPEVAERLWESGLPVIDHIHGDSYDWKTREKSPYYIDAIKNLQPGITEIIMHCTKPDETIDFITGGRELLYGDLFAMVDPEVIKTAEEEGIISVTWRELKHRRDLIGKGVSPNAKLVPTITEVEYSVAKRKPAALLVSVKGEVPTGGWSEPALVRRTYSEPPEDGVWEYDFYAVPPKGPATQAMTSIEAENVWEEYEGHGVRGIRVYGEGEGKEIKFGD